MNRTPGAIGIEGKVAGFVGADRMPGEQGRLGDDITLPVHLERASMNASLHLSPLTNRNHLQLETTANQIQPSSIPTSLPPSPPCPPEEKSTSIQSYLEQLEQNISIRQLTAQAEKVRIGWPFATFTGFHLGFSPWVGEA